MGEGERGGGDDKEAVEKGVNREKKEVNERRVEIVVTCLCGPEPAMHIWTFSSDASLGRAQYKQPATCLRATHCVRIIKEY